MGPRSLRVGRRTARSRPGGDDGHGDRLFRGGAQGQAGHAEHRGLLLDAARAGEHEADAAQERQEVEVAEGSAGRKRGTCAPSPRLRRTRDPTTDGSREVRRALTLDLADNHDKVRSFLQEDRRN